MSDIFESNSALDLLPSEDIVVLEADRDLYVGGHGELVERSGATLTVTWVVSTR